ncbi:High-affinity fructose transporter-like protein [Emericellopsis cladophorae]|uniref:High-affinity fructose transporter-like protein n=1 Tax=Emericellopsis cladophorae TaxID=2686198 RepID=A0A9P9Y9T4_9HYPO|nr:High-affinity fructose transporter-like protein [Emericellopsis cladophorae]KAI6785489.1 High-affinity fructose transporter-like protein [Emericellopsis cladophorae]
MLGRMSVKINGADCGAEAIFLGVITSIGGFLFGYDTGQISALLTFTDFVNRFAQGPEGDKAWQPIIQSLVVSLMSIGSLIGALTGAYTADWWGRRKSLTFGVIIFIIGNVIQVTAMRSWVHMMMGRFVAGLGVGNLSVGVPMFQSESSPREIRGAVVASYQLMITIGILVSNLINYGVREIQEQDASWRIVIGLGIFFSLPLGGGILAVPESPRWLAQRGRWEDARTSFARLRGMKDDPGNPLVEDDINEMRTILEKEQQVGSGTWLECFNPNTGVPKLVYRTLLGVGIHFLQQWTGVNYFFYYGATVFQSSGVDDPILVQLILGAVNVVMTLYGLWVVERFGRRWPLVIGAFWQSAWLVVFASMGTAIDVNNNSTAGIVMIVSACMFIASFAGTWGPIAWVVIGETFPLRTRAKQASLATAGNWLGNFMIGFLTPLATDGVGGSPGIGFAYGYVFAGTNFAAGLLVWFFLYESRTLSLENVDLMYGQKGLKPWTSHKWVPPGYVTRMERDTSAFRNMSVSGQNGNGHMAGEKKSDENSEDFMPGTTRTEHA